MIIKNDKIIARIDETGTTDSLVGWWSFNDNLNDVSGNGNNGTHSDTPAYVAGIPDGGKGLSFNGTSDYVDCDSGTSLNSTVYTMCAWIKTSVTAPDDTVGCRILTIRTSAGATITSLIQRGSKVGIRLGTVTISTTSINNTKWHHIVGVHSNGVSKIYVDGVQEGTTGNDTMSGIFGNVVIGMENSAGYFSGLIDDVRIYNRVLTATEIAQLCRSFKQNG